MNGGSRNDDLHTIVDDVSVVNMSLRSPLYTVLGEFGHVRKLETTLLLK